MQFILSALIQDLSAVQVFISANPRFSVQEFLVISASLRSALLKAALNEVLVDLVQSNTARPRLVRFSR